MKRINNLLFSLKRAVRRAFDLHLSNVNIVALKDYNMLVDGFMYDGNVVKYNSPMPAYTAVADAQFYIVVKKPSSQIPKVLLLINPKSAIMDAKWCKVFDVGSHTYIDTAAEMFAESFTDYKFDLSSLSKDNEGVRTIAWLKEPVALMHVNRSFNDDILYSSVVRFYHTLQGVGVSLSDGLTASFAHPVRFYTNEEIKPRFVKAKSPALSYMYGMLSRMYPDKHINPLWVSKGDFLSALPDYGPASMWMAIFERESGHAVEEINTPKDYLGEPRSDGTHDRDMFLRYEEDKDEITFYLIKDEV